MRLVTCRADGWTGVAVEKEGGVVRSSYDDMLTLVREGEAGLDKVRRETAGGPVIRDYKLLAPLRGGGKVLGGGINYVNHKEENPQAVFPKRPSVFAKLPNAISDPGDPIVLPYAECQADYEVELAFVIGKRGKAVAKAEAMDYVFGYMAMNDVSERALQFALQHEIIGKGVDTFCPLGPAIVTRDEIPDPSNLQLRSYVNGEVRQNANTSLMIFDIPMMIEAISAYITLEPGDIISTGTPAGVGTFRNPPSYLMPGDIVVVEVESVGRLENKVIAGW